MPRIRQTVSKSSNTKSYHSWSRQASRYQARALSFAVSGSFLDGVDDSLDDPGHGQRTSGPGPQRAAGNRSNKVMDALRLRGDGEDRPDVGSIGAGCGEIGGGNDRRRILFL